MSNDVFMSSSKVKDIIVSNEYPSDTFSGLPVKIIESYCQIGAIVLVKNVNTYTCVSPRFLFLAMGIPIFENCPYE